MDIPDVFALMVCYANELRTRTSPEESRKLTYRGGDHNSVPVNHLAERMLQHKTASRQS